MRRRFLNTNSAKIRDETSNSAKQKPKVKLPHTQQNALSLNTIAA